MRSYKYIIIHCSDSEWGDAKVIDSWHKERGFKEIGYNYVVMNGRRKTKNEYEASEDGLVELGRAITKEGAHCIGYNSNSIGICLIGVRDFTVAQYKALFKLINNDLKQYNIPIANILGHCETASGKKEGKTCPNINMNSLRLLLENAKDDEKFFELLKPK